MSTLKYATIVNNYYLKASSHFPKLTNGRRYSCLQYKSSRTFRQCEEVKIPVPWGHIAAVWWGPRDQQPVLALHGWQDNAYTWRPLMELIPPDVPVLAMDFPGQGLSSRYPHGMFYHSPDNIINIRRVVKHFGWKSVSLLGHSMGAIATFTYSALYPEEIDFTIQLDNIKPITSRRKNIIQYIARTIDNLLATDQRNIAGDEPPGYYEKELIERVYHGSGGSIGREASPVLLERGAARSVKDASKYFYTRDSKLKFGLTFGLSEEDVHLMVTRLTFPMLAIKFENGSYFEPKEVFDRTLHLLQNHNKLFEFHTVPGTHHSHFNTPHVVAPLVEAFIRKHRK